MLNKAYTVQSIKISCQSIAKEFTVDMQSSDMLFDECLNFKIINANRKNLFISVEIH